MIDNENSRNKITLHLNHRPIYTIYFQDSFLSLSDVCRKLHMTDHKVCIVTDNTVAEYYLQDVTDVLKSVCSQVFHFIFPAGEQNKNLSTVNALYQ